MGTLKFMPKYAQASFFQWKIALEKIGQKLTHANTASDIIYSGSNLLLFETGVWSCVDNFDSILKPY